MDVKHNLIILKGKDITRDLASCVFDEKSGKWKITYVSSRKIYSANRENLEYYQNPTSILPDAIAVYLKGQLLTNIDTILDFGPYIRVVFQLGSQAIYRRDELCFESHVPPKPHAAEVLNYLKQVASIIKMKDDDSNSFLGREYEAMTTVHRDSVLWSYLGQSSPKKRDGFSNIIFPFGFNLSQKKAVNNALSSSVSMIEGPPGTGKTQTILTIIANAVINGKTVAVVSNNNHATLNVYEKLQKYGLNFFCAYLGKKENKEHFFDETQHNSYPDMAEWHTGNSQGLKDKLVQSHEKLDEMLAIQNSLASLKQQQDGLSVEKHYFDQYYVSTQHEISLEKDLNLKQADKYLSLLVEFQQSKKNNKAIGLFRKFYYFLTYGIRDFNFYKLHPEQIVSHLQKKYYEKRSEELACEINTLEKKLTNFHFEKAMEKYCEQSMILFKNYLAKSCDKKQKEQFTIRDFISKYDRFIKQYPVILSTTHSLRKCAAKGYLFDYVIADEASQIDLASGGIALSCGKNIIIVGDEKQLPNIVEQKYKKVLHKLWEHHRIPEAYHYVHNSLLSSAGKIFSDAPKILLKEHYRCHPKIIGFCNQKFYGGQLVVLTKMSSEEKPMIVYRTVKGNHARGRYNQRQIDVVFEEVIPQQKLLQKESGVAIISPYRPQADKITEEIDCQGYEDKIIANTVHKFQGMEKDVIVFTTVSNKINDFIDNPSLINVAVSRAKNQLIIVAADYENEGNLTNIGDLIKYIDYHNFDIIKSKVYSVFDLLYKQYADELLQFVRKRKKVSKYNSENLMNALIQKVLSEQEFLEFDQVWDYPLSMLIQDLLPLTESEQQFVQHPNTHIDFLIFSRIDKSPLLAIEVDGYAFHANNSEQLERDKTKDEILRKYGIPILRFATNGSGEERKLRENLREIIG